MSFRKKTSGIVKQIKGFFMWFWDPLMTKMDGSKKQMHEHPDGSRTYANRKDALAWMHEIEKEGVAKIQINRDGTTRIYDLSVNDINAKAMAKSRAKIDTAEFIDAGKATCEIKIYPTTKEAAEAAEIMSKAGYDVAVGGFDYHESKDSRVMVSPGMIHTPGTPVMGAAMKSANEIAKSMRPLLGDKAVKALIESAGDKDVIAVLRNRLGVANVMIQNLDEANGHLQRENVFLRDVIAGDSPADLWVSVEDKDSLPPTGEQVNILFKNKSCSSGSMDAYRNGFNVGPGGVYYPMKYISHWQKIWYPNVTEEAK